MRLALAPAVMTVLFGCGAQAADVVVTVPEQALANFAAAVKPVSGGGSYVAFLRLPRLVPTQVVSPSPIGVELASMGERMVGSAQLAKSLSPNGPGELTGQEVSKGQPVANFEARTGEHSARLAEPALDAPAPKTAFDNLRMERVLPDRIQGPDELNRAVAYIPFPVSTLNWTWKVLTPRFVVTTSGVRLEAVLSISDGLSTKLVAFERSVSVGVQTQNSQQVISFTVASDPVQVFWNIASRTVQIGTVDVAPFFSTALFFKQRNFYVAGRTLVGSISNISVAYRTGSIQLTGDVQF